MHDPLRFAFDELVPAVAFLAEACQAIRAAGGDAFLEAVRILRDNQLAGADLHRALRHYHVAFEDLHLVDVVHADTVGFEVDGFFAVALFRVGCEGYCEK